MDRTRLHHEVVPWYLGDVPDGEYRSCDELTQNIDWATAESQPCSRPAHVMYGELALCWQHERSIVYHLRGDERTVPVGMSETRFSYGAIAELEQWLDAKRAREARAAEAAEREAADAAHREAEERLHRAAARAARRRHPRDRGPTTYAASSSRSKPVTRSALPRCLTAQHHADTKRTHQKRHTRRLATHRHPLKQPDLQAKPCAG